MIELLIILGTVYKYTFFCKKHWLWFSAWHAFICRLISHPIISPSHPLPFAKVCSKFVSGQDLYADKLCLGLVSEMARKIDQPKC